MPQCFFSFSFLSVFASCSQFLRQLSKRTINSLIVSYRDQCWLNQVSDHAVKASICFDKKINFVSGTAPVINYSKSNILRGYNPLISFYTVPDIGGNLENWIGTYSQLVESEVVCDLKSGVMFSDTGSIENAIGSLQKKISVFTF